MADHAEVKCEPSTTPAASTGGDNGQDGSVSDSVKLMADKHATIRSHLKQAELELGSKLDIIKDLEEKIRAGSSRVSIAEQKLHGLNETFHRNSEILQNLERLHEELVQESVDLDVKILKETEMMEEIKAKEKANSILMEEHKKQVTEVESTNPARMRQEEKLRQLQTEYKQLLELEEHAKSGDPELEKITSGQALQIVEAQKIAIMEAFSEQQMELEQLRQQLADKHQEIRSLEQSIKVEDKQNQARLLRMQKQLNELEETEQHLRKTALHLESQRDFGMA